MQDNIKKAVIQSLFPKDRNNAISDEDRFVVTAMHLEFKEKGNGFEVFRNGKVMVNPKSLNPLSAEEAVRSFFEERDWIMKKGDQPATENTFSGFEKRWKEENPNGNTMSPEFSKALSEHASKCKDFNYYS